MNIRKRLKEERIKLGFTNQGAFAEKIGVSKTTQVYYEQGKTSPNNEYWQKAANLGADIQYILTGNRSNKIQEENQEYNSISNKLEKLKNEIEELIQIIKKIK